jgi:hypothetical protein
MRIGYTTNGALDAATRAIYGSSVPFASSYLYNWLIVYGNGNVGCLLRRRIVDEKAYDENFLQSWLLCLIAVSLVGVFPATAADKTTDEYTDFMENVLSVDVSKYNIKLASNFKDDHTNLLDVNRKITSLKYELTSEQSKLDITFSIEKGVISSCGVYSLRGEVITTKQYSSQLDAVNGFLERYQTYTKLLSNNLIAMLNKVDITKNSTINRRKHET